MRDFLRITYISPVSDHVFEKKYILCFISSNKNDVTINKINIDRIGNVTDRVRGFAVDKTIMIQNPIQKVALFEFFNNSLQILFSASLDINELDHNNRSRVILKQAKKSVVDYKTAASFLDERLYSDETINGSNSCIVFFSKIDRPIDPLIKPVTFCVTKRVGEHYIYNRYHQLLLKEYHPIHFKTVSEQQRRHLARFKNANYDYADFLKEYKIDTSIYRKCLENRRSFRFLHTRRVDLKFRPLRFYTFKNNTITSPTDSRMRDFKINPSSTFILEGKKFNMLTFTGGDKLIYGGGLLARVLPHDYQRIYMPYSGHLVQVAKFIQKDHPTYIMLKFESDYFMPPSVGERDMLAVTYGNFIHHGVGVGGGSRYRPDLLEPQPDVKLVFYLVIMGDKSISNAKLEEMEKVIKNRFLHTVKPRIWFEQGEELGYFTAGGGYVIVAFNRYIDPNPEIQNYSRYNIDSYVRARDIVGSIL